MTRRRIDETVIAEALRRIRDDGEPVRAVAEELGIGKTTLFDRLNAIETKSAKRTKTAAPAVPAASPRNRAARSAGPPVEPPPLKSTPGSPDEDLEIIDLEIAEVRRQLAEARADVRAGRASRHGLGALGKHLTDLVKRRSELRPPVVDSGGEEQRWRSAANEVIVRIRNGVGAAHKMDRRCPRCGGTFHLRELYLGPDGKPVRLALVDLFRDVPEVGHIVAMFWPEEVLYRVARAEPVDASLGGAP